MLECNDYKYMQEVLLNVLILDGDNSKTHKMRYCSTLRGVFHCIEALHKQHEDQARSE